MLGSHMIKSWSTTQSVIALSSGEAEYYGIVKGATIGLGTCSITKELGVELDLRVSTDSSAAKGIASRRGLGKIRHIAVQELWLQEKVSGGALTIRKVPGTGNLADALTKSVDAASISRHMQWTSQSARSGRHAIMPDIAQEGLNYPDADQNFHESSGGVLAVSGELSVDSACALDHSVGLDVRVDDCANGFAGCVGYVRDEMCGGCVCDLSPFVCHVCGKGYCECEVM